VYLGEVEIGRGELSISTLQSSEVYLGEVEIGRGEVSTSVVKCIWVKLKLEEVKCRQV